VEFSFHPLAFHFRAITDPKNKYFCTECKKNMCEYCKMEDLEHFKNNKIKDLKTLELDKKDNIDKIRKETGLKDPKEYHYKSRKQELKEFLASKLDSRIVDLSISIRALNVLKSLNCYTLRDVIKLSPKEIFETRNCGKKTLAEIIECLKDEGLELGMDESKFFEKKK
jgi:DNA-directed RNA polymerase alpha subunit